jgi:hypothetical protein
VTVELAVAAAPVPLIRSLTTSLLGGAPEGIVTFGLVLRAAGSGVLLVVVLVALADAVPEEDALLVVAVALAVVAPPDGAVTMPAALVPLLLLPQPATAAARASAAQVMVVVFRIGGRG